MASRAYSRIKPSAAAQNLPPWRPSDAIGRAGGSVFTRASGRKLSDGIPGFLTVDGFHKVLLPALATATREVAAESWVLGQKVPVNFDLSKQSEVANEVVKQYMEDYAKAWDGLLQDLEITPLRSLNQASQDLYILASKQSPLKELLVAIARQLDAVGAAEAFGCRGGRSSGSGKGREGEGGGNSAHGGEIRGSCRFACRPGRCSAGTSARSSDRRTLQAAP